MSNGSVSLRGRWLLDCAELSGAQEMLSGGPATESRQPELLHTVPALLRSWGSRPHAHAPVPSASRCLSALAPPTIYTSTPTRSHSCHILSSKHPGDSAYLEEYRFCSLAVLDLSPSLAAQSCVTLDNFLFLAEFQWPHMAKGSIACCTYC